MSRPTRCPRIFLDSGDPDDTDKTKSLLGFLDGQTTNPSLVTKNPDVARYLEKGKKLTEKELLKLYRQIIEALSKKIPGAVSVEVYADWKTKAEVMLAQAEEMKTWGRNIHVKFPVIPEGLKAANEFVKKGGKVNMTLVFDQEQAAAAYFSSLSDPAGQNGEIAFVSPFVGRWDDRGYRGLDLIENIAKMYKAYNKQIKVKNSHIAILSASIRSLEHVYGSIINGADILTLPLKVIKLWIEDGFYIPDKHYRINTKGLRALPYKTLPFNRDFSIFQIDHKKGSLLEEGLTKFVKDWKSLIK